MRFVLRLVMQAGAYWLLWHNVGWWAALAAFLVVESLGLGGGD